MKRYFLLITCSILLTISCHGQLTEDMELLRTCLDELNTSRDFIEMKWTFDYSDSTKTKIYNSDEGLYAIHNHESAMLWKAKIIRLSKDSVNVLFVHTGERNRLFTLTQNDTNWTIKDLVELEQWTGYFREFPEEIFKE